MNWPGAALNWYSGSPIVPLNPVPCRPMPTPPIEKPEFSPWAEAASGIAAPKIIANTASLLRIKFSFREGERRGGILFPARVAIARLRACRPPGLGRKSIRHGDAVSGAEWG